MASILVNSVHTTIPVYAYINDLDFLVTLKNFIPKFLKLNQ